MRLENAINIEDLRLAAKRRLPRLAFDFIERAWPHPFGQRGGRRRRAAFDRVVEQAAHARARRCAAAA